MTTRELLELIAACEDDDSLAVLRSASHAEHSVHVEIVLTSYAGSDEGLWKIEAIDPVAVLLPVGEDVAFEHYERAHPLLLPYVADR